MPRVFCVQPEFDMSLRVDHCSKSRNYKIFSESDSKVIMSTFISQGRDNIFYAVFTLACVYHLARNTMKSYLEYRPDKICVKNSRGSGNPPVQ